MNKIEFDDIIGANALGVYWTGNSYYPAKELTSEEEEIFKQIKATQLRFIGAGNDRSKYDMIFADCFKELKNIIFNNKHSAHLVLIENGPKPKSKIRSFKGILPKKELDSNSYLELEVLLSDENNTLICGIVLIDKQNFDRIIPSIGNNRKGFVIQSSGNLKTEKFLKWLVERCLTNNYDIDYFKLIKSCIVKDSNIIYRISGDGGDTSLNIDMFYSILSK